jgi:hypothetical protein
LAVEVTDIEDRVRPEGRIGSQVDKDLAARVLRPIDAQQERQRRGDVDGADARHGVQLLDAWTGRHKCGVHIHVVGNVDELWQVAMLAEELAERDSDAWGAGV